MDREKQMGPLKPTTDINFKCISNRLKTYKGWPITFLSAKRLAGNGFYYLGLGATVRCAYCQLELVQWVEGDDPLKKHQYGSPNCCFANLQIQTGTDLETENYKTIISLEILKMSDDYGYHVSMDIPRDAHLNLTGAAHPCYESEGSRLRSFQDSPCMQNSENLAAAGFFYVGPDDETKCYYCDGGLKDWEPDDVPWEQHARWFGTCAYVKLVKGQDYIQYAMTKGYSMTANRKDVKSSTYKTSLENCSCVVNVICRDIFALQQVDIMNTRIRKKVVSLSRSISSPSLTIDSCGT